MFSAPVGLCRMSGVSANSAAVHSDSDCKHTALCPASLPNPAHSEQHVMGCVQRSHGVFPCPPVGVPSFRDHRGNSDPRLRAGAEERQRWPDGPHQDAHFLVLWHEGPRQKVRRPITSGNRECSRFLGLMSVGPLECTGFPPLKAIHANNLACWMIGDKLYIWDLFMVAIRGTGMSTRDTVSQYHSLSTTLQSCRAVKGALHPWQCRPLLLWDLWVSSRKKKL